MKRQAYAEDARVKRKVWRFRESAVTYTVMLLISGVHAGLIILVIALELPIHVQVLVPLIYWAIMAAVFIRITNNQIKIIMTVRCVTWAVRRGMSPQAIFPFI